MSPTPSQPPFSYREERNGRVLLLGISESVRAACKSAVTALYCEWVTVQNPVEVREQVKSSLPTCVVAPLTSEYLHAIEDQNDTLFRRLAIVIIGEDKIVKHLQDIGGPAFTIAATTEEIETQLDIAIKLAGDTQRKWDFIEDFQRRLDLLTSDEKEVLDDVCLGVLNKQLAKKIGVSIRTIEQRRRRVFEKMEVESAIPLAGQLATYNSLLKPLRRRDSSHIKGGLIGPNSPDFLNVLSRLDSQ